MNTLDSRGHRVMTDSVLMMLREREFNGSGRVFQKAAHVTESMIKRLGKVSQLEGHEGCVNCLEWSPNGNLLISGSDDTKIIVWDPLRKKKIAKLHTRHMGNIFSAKFLPQTNCNQIVTGAGDSFVTVINVESATEKSSRPLLLCRCHKSRIKRIATVPDLPDVFWTAGEDGLILQYDLREPHQCAYEDVSASGAKLLVDLNRHAGWNTEAKCVSINPMKPHLLAVGANDPYARLYDRRMMKACTYSNNHYTDSREECLAKIPVLDECVPQGCAKFFAPAHLPDGGGLHKYATTFVAFSPEGNELLANLGGDHIYLYDVNRVQEFNLTKPEIPKPRQFNKCCENLSDEVPLNEPKTKVPTLIPSCSCDFIHRADALMQRNWIGDYYAAARDYHTALNLCGLKVGRRALVGLVSALVKLEWWTAAVDWLNLLQKHYPKLGTDLAEVLSKSQNAEPKLSQLLGNVLISPQETKWRAAASDYQKRFVGHCNTTTDIKEAAFIGQTGNYIAAGSDDGIMYIWRRDNMELTTAVKADKSILNCVQPHPLTCLVATSGIETVIKLWQPLSDNKSDNGYLIENMDRAVAENQERLSISPFESMFIDMEDDLDRFTQHYPQNLPMCQTS